MKGRNREADGKPGEPNAIVRAVSNFYIEVAQALDLPRKDAPAAAPPTTEETRDEATLEISAQPALSRYRVWLLPILAALLLMVMGAYYWWPADTFAVPEDFRGTWVSRNPSYAGRMIVVSGETIEIVSGRSAATGPLTVTSSTVQPTTDGMRLRLVFGKSGSEQTLVMVLHPGHPATLTLLRPADVVWERLVVPSVRSTDGTGAPHS